MKGLILYGPGESGKSLLAKRFAAAFPEKQVVWISAKNKNLFDSPFTLMHCTRETKMIVFDDCSDNFPWYLFLSCFRTKKNDETVFRLEIERPRLNSITIEVPNIVFTTNYLPIDIEKLDEYPSFLERFEIVEIEKARAIDEYTPKKSSASTEYTCIACGSTIHESGFCKSCNDKCLEIELKAETENAKQNQINTDSPLQGI